MFSRILALLPFAVLVASSHLEARDQCDTGSISCCDSTQTFDQASSMLAANNLLSVAAGIPGMVGLSCTPITGIGADTACVAQQQPVCCTDNQMNGLINLGCSPININA